MAFKLPKTHDTQLKIDDFLVHNSDIWHTFLSKICANSNDLSKNRLDDLAGFATEKLGYRSHFWKITFLPKMHHFGAQKKRIFKKKSEYILCKKNS